MAFLIHLKGIPHDHHVCGEMLTLHALNWAALDLLAPVYHIVNT